MDISILQGSSANEFSMGIILVGGSDISFKGGSSYTGHLFYLAKSEVVDRRRRLPSCGFLDFFVCG